MEGKKVMLYATKSVEVEGLQDAACVRVNFLRTGLYEKISEDEVRLTAVAFIDLGGWLPT